MKKKCLLSVATLVSLPLFAGCVGGKTVALTDDGGSKMGNIDCGSKKVSFDSQRIATTPALAGVEADKWYSVEDVVSTVSKLNPIGASIVGTTLPAKISEACK
ncbi:MAG: hypothetical protein VKK98_08600 [Cyanobacteriota bacterium]|nr:hypothetical protein [Cyanobacteriota bacterium]